MQRGGRETNVKYMFLVSVYEEEFTMVKDLLETEDLAIDEDLERTVEFINISELDEADEYVARLSYDFDVDFDDDF